MNAKEAKKIRKLYRRDVAHKASEMAALIGNAMKPKPRFIPMKMWVWLASIFIKVRR